MVIIQLQVFTGFKIWIHTGFLPLEIIHSTRIEIRTPVSKEKCLILMKIFQSELPIEAMISPATKQIK